MKNFIIIFVSLVGIACQQKTEQQDNRQSASQHKENVSLITNIEYTGGESAPNFMWYNEQGKQISFSEFSKGKPVLVNFWATWCGPCIKETPDLVQLNEEYKAQGALFIGVSEDRGDDAMDLVTEFTKEYKVPYQIVIDNKGELQEAFGGVRGYPTTFYIDRNGKIVKKLLGLQTKEKFESEFKNLL